MPATNAPAVQAPSTQQRSFTISPGTPGSRIEGTNRYQLPSERKALVERLLAERRTKQGQNDSPAGRPPVTPQSGSPQQPSHAPVHQNLATTRPIGQFISPASVATPPYLPAAGRAKPHAVRFDAPDSRHSETATSTDSYGHQTQHTAFQHQHTGPTTESTISLNEYNQQESQHQHQHQHVHQYSYTSSHRTQTTQHNSAQGHIQPTAGALSARPAMPPPAPTHTTPAPSAASTGNGTGNGTGTGTNAGPQSARQSVSARGGYADSHDTAEEYHGAGVYHDTVQGTLSPRLYAGRDGSAPTQHGGAGHSPSEEEAGEEEEGYGDMRGQDGDMGRTKRRGTGSSPARQRQGGVKGRKGGEAAGKGGVSTSPGTSRSMGHTMRKKSGGQEGRASAQHSQGSYNGQSSPFRSMSRTMGRTVDPPKVPGGGGGDGSRAQSQPRSRRGKSLNQTGPRRTERGHKYKV